MCELLQAATALPAKKKRKYVILLHPHVYASLGPMAEVAYQQNKSHIVMRENTKVSNTTVCLRAESLYHCRAV